MAKARKFWFYIHDEEADQVFKTGHWFTEADTADSVFYAATLVAQAFKDTCSIFTGK